MNEAQLASIVLGVVAGFYMTIFLLCLSDVVYLSKEMNQIKLELADIRKSQFNRSLISIDPSHVETSLKRMEKNISGPFCFSFSEQRQILDYMNFLCNMAILIWGTYSIYVYGLGTHHGLAYRFVFFIFKIITILLSICLNLSFKQGLPNDIFLYVWIDINCIASIFRSLRQSSF